MVGAWGQGLAMEVEGWCFWLVGESVKKIHYGLTVDLLIMCGTERFSFLFFFSPSFLWFCWESREQLEGWKKPSWGLAWQWISDNNSSEVSCTLKIYVPLGYLLNFVIIIVSISFLVLGDTQKTSYHTLSTRLQPTVQLLVIGWGTYLVMVNEEDDYYIRY